mmetsp:Transcript_13713/g.27563  ORF Transcript_13713/g.27563 Transcript_13713/m.27563 type:complete len:282 (+) Transcript_13713:803-1648(+)
MPRRQAGTTCGALRCAPSPWILASTRSIRTPRILSLASGPALQSALKAATRCSATVSTPWRPKVLSTRTLAPAASKPRILFASFFSQGIVESLAPSAGKSRSARARALLPSLSLIAPLSMASTTEGESGVATNQKRLCLLAVLPSAPGLSAVLGVAPATLSRYANDACLLCSWLPSAPISSRSLCSVTSMCSSPAAATTCSPVSASKCALTRGSDRCSAGSASASLRAPSPAPAETARNSIGCTLNSMEAMGGAVRSEATVPDRGRRVSRPTKAQTLPAAA